MPSTSTSVMPHQLGGALPTRAHQTGRVGLQLTPATVIEERELWTLAVNRNQNLLGKWVRASGWPGRQQSSGHVVATLGCQRVPVAQVAEDRRAFPVIGLIVHARHDMNVEMRKAFGLSEQHDVGLLAAGDRLERDRCLPEKTAEFDSFLRSQLIERLDVPQRSNDESALQTRVEVVRDAPATSPNETLAERRVEGGLFTGVTLRRHVPSLTDNPCNSMRNRRCAFSAPRAGGSQANVRSRRGSVAG